MQLGRLPAEVWRVGRSENSPRGSVAEWAVTLLLLLFGTTTLVQAFVIPTGSMEDNLLIGDHLLVDKLAYSPAGPISKYLLPYTPIKRGDIIVFRFPVDIRETYVKRVIGLPGDRVRIESKQVYLNGKALHEPYNVHKTAHLAPYRDTFPPAPGSRVNDPAVYPRAMEMLRHIAVEGSTAELVVPADSYFAMGDNRDFSSDCRYWGFVPRENIIGKPLVIYWSYDASTEDLKGFGLDHMLDLAKNFFSKTRWDRTFQLVRGYPIP